MNVPNIFGTRTCTHCGRVIPSKTVVDDESGKSYTIPDKCTCEGAVKESERQDKIDRENKISDFRARQSHARFNCGDSITDDYFNLGLDTYNRHDGNQQAILDAEQFISAMSKPIVSGISRRMLYLHGLPGTGKTMLAHIVNYELMRAGVYVAYVRTSRLCDVARDWKRWSYLLSTPRVVFIDDLGKENRSGYKQAEFESALFDIVDKITGQPNRGLIVTTEFPIKTLLTEMYPEQKDALKWRLKKLLKHKKGGPSSISTIKKSDNTHKNKS